MNFDPNEMTPEFLSASEAYMAHVEAGTEDSPAGNRAFMQMLEHAPETLLAAMNAKARELDLLPSASGYMPDGSPVFTAEAVAEKLGVPVSEVMAQIEQFRSDGIDLAVDPATVSTSH